MAFVLLEHYSPFLTGLPLYLDQDVDAEMSWGSRSAQDSLCLTLRRSRRLWASRSTTQSHHHTMSSRAPNHTKQLPTNTTFLHFILRHSLICWLAYSFRKDLLSTNLYARYYIDIKLPKAGPDGAHSLAKE